MARMASEARLGFFPIPEDAVAGICKHLQGNAEKPQDVQILDTCAGEGLAIRQIAGHLGLPMSNIHCVELDEGRAQKCRQSLPGARVLGPASFLGTHISGKSFGLIYCNPPFGDELGGGRREEQAFVERAVRLLHHKGTLVLVLPINAVHGNSRFVSYLDSRFQDIAAYRFPDHCRKYNEIVLFARLRPAAIPDDKLFELGSLHKMGWRYGYGTGDPARLPNLGDCQPASWHNGHASFDREPEPGVHVLPWSWRPSKFEKAQYTDAELLKELATSPLVKLLHEVHVLPPKEPPISISQNHLAMLLGSGELDGTIYYFDPVTGEEVEALRHVVRGVTSKKEYYNEEASSVRIDAEAETVHIKNVWSQIINLDLHGFGTNGKLYCWSQGRSSSDDDGETEDPSTRPQAEQQHARPEPGSGKNHGYPDDYDFDLAAQLARMTVESGCTPHEAAQAQARLKCVREGKKWVAQEWDQFIDEFVARYQTADQKEAA